MKDPSRLDFLMAKYVFGPCIGWVSGIAIYAFIVALIMSFQGNLGASISALVGGAALIGIYLWAARSFWRRWAD